MAAITGAALCTGLAVAAGAAVAGRRRRSPASLRASDSRARLLADDVPAPAPEPPLMPPAPRKPRARKAVCAPTPGKYWVSMCMDMPAGPGPTVQSAPAVCKVLRAETNIDRADRESFYAVLLDVRNQVMGIAEVARGTMTGVEVHPREAFRSAVMAGASAVVFAHNHPSGDATPSDDDIQLTRNIVKAGHMIGVPVLDHVVVGKQWPGKRDSGCVSISELRPRLFSRDDD